MPDNIINERWIKMGFKDLLKNAKDAASTMVSGVKETMDQKKAEKEAYKAEMTKKAADKAQEIINTILEYKNENTLFCGIPKDEVMAFTKGNTAYIVIKKKRIRP